MRDAAEQGQSFQAACAVIANCNHHPDQAVLNACEIVMLRNRDSVEARRASMLHETLMRFATPT